MLQTDQDRPVVPVINGVEIQPVISTDFRSLEQGGEPEEVIEQVEHMIASTGSDYLARAYEAQAGIALAEARFTSERFRHGVQGAHRIAAEIRDGREFEWWDIEAYRDAMQPGFDVTSDGQFVTVLGPYALNRVSGAGPVMYANHAELFADQQDSTFLDGLTNATVTNFGQGFPNHMVAVGTMNRLTGGAQCVPYHPGPLVEQAGEALISIAPIESQGAKVAWFNSGGDAVSVGITAAEIYSERVHGENGRRSAVYFQEAYHGNIEGRAGKVTGGINEAFHHDDRNAIELEYPNLEEEVEPVLDALIKEVDAGHVSCVVFEPTQGDGGGVSMHPNFFNELVRLSLDKQVPLVVDEVQSGFGRSGRVFDVEHLLEHWRNSEYVVQHGYPEKPPMIMALAKSMTNGAIPGSAVVLPQEYAVLGRAQGLNTFSAFPGTLAATMASVDLMRRPEVHAMVRHKRQLFEEALAGSMGEGRLIRGIRGNGLHMFLDINPGYEQVGVSNQTLQVDLIGRKCILAGTVARNGLRVHAPINAPDEVYEALARGIGDVAVMQESGLVSPQARQILHGNVSGLASR